FTLESLISSRLSAMISQFAAPARITVQPPALTLSASSSCLVSVSGAGAQAAGRKSIRASLAHAGIARRRLARERRSQAYEYGESAHLTCMLRLGCQWPC